MEMKFYGLSPPGSIIAKAVNSSFSVGGEWRTGVIRHLAGRDSLSSKERFWQAFKTFFPRWLLGDPSFLERRDASTLEQFRLPTEQHPFPSNQVLTLLFFSPSSNIPSHFPHQPLRNKFATNCKNGKSGWKEEASSRSGIVHHWHRCISWYPSIPKQIKGKATSY